MESLAYSSSIMRKAFISASIVLLLTAQPVPVLATEDTPTQPHVLIVEVQTGSMSTGTEEFIELYNPSDQPVDVTGWQLQYRPATALPTDEWKASSSKATLQCLQPAETECKVLIEPHQRLLLSTYQIAGTTSLVMKSGLADAGGQVRLINLQQEVQDLVGYGAAQTAEGNKPATQPAAGKSLQREVGQDGEYVDTNVNADDFAVACDDPTPGKVEDPQAPKIDCSEPADESVDEPVPADDPDTGTPVPGQGAGPVAYAQLNITEVLPDPASPQTDANDEFVEIYNPNDEPVQLEDYILQTGSSFQNRVVIGSGVIAPHGYAVVTSGDSSLSLSNNGTGVRLLDPSGVLRYEAPSYGKALAGQGWMFNGSTWQWTTTPTAAAANLLTLPPPPAAKSTTKKAASSSVTKKATPKTSVAKVASASTSKPAESSLAEDNKESSVPLHYWVIGGIGALVLGYGIYEYRNEIGKGFTKLRSLVSRGS